MSGLPDGMANGPSRSGHMGKEAQIWERPWTLEEIRQSSDSWSLAADSGLFLFLQDFSQRMLSKTHEIEKQLDSLIRDTKATDSCLHSVFNDFLMLSNTQFIENRVYDEEVEDTVSKAEALEKLPEQKTREQKEAELIPKMQEAVNYGLRVLESAFEQLDIKAGNSDSEDEEATDRVEAILEPKDLYVDRPLPYLIGSQAFMEQDDVGLGDLSSDEMSVDSDRDSVIESEDGKEADHSDDDFTQDECHNNNKKKSSMLSYEDDEDDEDEDSDIFGESDKDDEDDTNNTGPSSFADELAARIKGEPPAKPEGDRASITSKKKSKSRKAPKPAKPEADDDSDDMFKPPKMDDEEYSPFGGKSGLFSGGRGLFDDDDESDLFAEAPKAEKPLNEAARPTAQTAESSKPGKKIPPGAVAIFPDNNLFSSGNESDSVESKENGAPVSQSRPASKQAPPSAGGGGLFDDDDDDFFGGKSSKKSHSAQQEKPKPKKAVDLFDDDDEDGDIFSEKYSASTPAPSKKVEKEPAKPPEKKMPAGAISMFGPGTKNVITEGLRKRQPSTSEESEKSEENGFVPDVGKVVKQPQKPQPSSLFSDDEDTQVFPTATTSQSKPEATSRGKPNKAPLLLFDDEEDEDLFASAAKPKPKAHQEKASTPQPSKAASSSLFSDDDEWLSSKASAAKQESRSGGMKASASAPASLPSSLFDDDSDDLFAPAKETNQTKPQRVALLFEDENEEEKGSLFGSKPAVATNTAAPAAKTPAVDSQSRSLCEESDEVAVSKTEAEDKPSEQPKVAAKPPVIFPPSPETSEGKKKPAGAVSLFGGIDVFASKQTKLDEVDGGDDLLSKDSPLPDVRKEEKKEEKAKTNTVSLFDDEEEDESDWSDPIFTPSKPAARNTPKPAEERPQAKSTGVFQDEELLFSHTQQKDNDPDVDLFATSGKATSSKVSSVKPAVPGLFSDDDEDDLFGSSKPKSPPPKVAEKPSISSSKAPMASPESESEVQKPAPSPVKPKEPSSRIGKLQANLMINPAMLLPGAAPTLPGAKSVLPATAASSSSGVSSSSLTPSPASTPGAAPTDSEGGVSFDAPAQVSMLQSANKSRAKGSVHRRPQSRAARQQAAQKSIGDGEESLGRDAPAASKPGGSGSVLPPPDKSNQTRVSPTPPNTTASAALAPSSSSSSSSSSFSSHSEPSLTEVSPRPSVLTLPVSTNAANKDSGKDGTPPGLPSLEDDLFGSDSLFGADLATNTPSAKHTTKTAQHSADSAAATTTAKKDTSTLPSIFDDNRDDLFQKVKPKSAAKKPKASSFLEEDDDDDDDIFGVSNNVTPSSTSSKDIKNSSSFSKQNIFEDDVATVPKANKKSKEKPIDASLFDDNIDIFADLTDTFVPKHKSKAKAETKKSIFDDDMDDIFSSSTVIKPMTKAPPQTKKQPPSQESSTTADPVDIFDDPLNALGGN